jgi:tetratricopeptide (TPR) repeat protein
MTSTDTNRAHYTEGMDAFSRGDFGKSESLFTHILNNNPDHKLALVSRGAARLNDARPDVAIDDFNRALELDPSYARAFHLRGLAQERQDNHPAAIDDFGRALEIDPDYGAAYYSRASLFAKIGRDADAAADMQMVAHMTQRNLTDYAHENNMIRSEHLRVEDGFETELNR